MSEFEVVRLVLGMIVAMFFGCSFFAGFFAVIRDTLAWVISLLFVVLESSYLPLGVMAALKITGYQPSTVEAIALSLVVATVCFGVVILGMNSGINWIQDSGKNRATKGEKSG